MAKKRLTKEQELEKAKQLTEMKVVHSQTEINEAELSAEAQKKAAEILKQLKKDGNVFTHLPHPFCCVISYRPCCTGHST